MNQLQTTQKKQGSFRNPMHQTGRFEGFSKAVVHPYLQAQGIIGNHGILRRHSGDIIQAKLKIGQPNDKYEQEADRVADQVMRMPEPKGSLVNGHSSLVQKKFGCPECPEKEGIQTKSIADQITPLVQRQAEPEEEEVQTKLQRQAEEEEEEEEEPVQTKLLQRQEAEEEEEDKIQRQPQEEKEKEPIQAKPAHSQTPAVTSNIESSVNSLKGGGQTLSESTRSFFEPRFGTDFSQVRVHSDSNASKVSRSINARAFTRGKDIVFGSGFYSPETTSGKKLLAHELTHVVQQGLLDGSNKISNNNISDIQRFPNNSGASKNPRITFSANFLALTSKKNIPPRKQFNIDVHVSGWKQGTAPIILSIKTGKGGYSVHGKALLNNLSFIQLKRNGKFTIRLKGTKQTSKRRIRTPKGLAIIAKQGKRILGKSTTFTVAAHPSSVKMKFKGIVKKEKVLGRGNTLWWGGQWNLDFDSDSGFKRDIWGCEVDEQLWAPKSVGLFASPYTLLTRRGMYDTHALPGETYSVAEFRQNIIRKYLRPVSEKRCYWLHERWRCRPVDFLTGHTYYNADQLYRCKSYRSGTLDRIIPYSGFRIRYEIRVKGSSTYAYIGIRIIKKGHSHHGVAAGMVVGKNDTGWIWQRVSSIGYLLIPPRPVERIR